MFIGLLLMASMQISFQACSDDSDEKVAECNAEINTPTNDYYVAANIYKLGILGCVLVTVEQNGQPIEDANVTISSKQLTIDDFGIYSDTANALTYEIGTGYDLEVHVGGSLIASGFVQMPSTPEIIGQTDTVNHTVNTPYNISWSTLTGASSVQISIDNDSQADDYDSPFLSPSQTTFTIPSQVFTHNGTYGISVSALCGIPSDMTISEPDSTKGYSIDGAAGYLIATNVSEQLVLKVTGGIDGPSLNVKSKEDHLLKPSNPYTRIRKYFKQYKRQALF